jgi:hypothetical protein
VRLRGEGKGGTWTRHSYHLLDAQFFALLRSSSHHLCRALKKPSVEIIQ